MDATVPAEWGFKYDVFISYSRRDAAFARALEKALEAYRPPRDLAVPHRNLKVFRDEDDFQGVEYTSAVDRDLHQSAKLIVICSPRSAASGPVNDEIRRFAECRGAEHIISVLLDGIPNNEVKPGQEDRQAFPDELVKRQAMPLANPFLNFDASRDRIDRGVYLNAWYKTLADIYDVDRPLIEQREQRRLARRRRVVVSIVGSIMAALSALTIWALVERGVAQDQRDLARSRELAASANLQLQRDPEVSVLLAIEAAEHKPTQEAEAALRSALRESHVRRVIRGDWKDVLALKPDGTRALALGDDEKVRVIDLENGRPEYDVSSADGYVRLADFSDDGRLLTLDDASVVRIWQNRRTVASFAIGRERAIAWAVKPDASAIAVADGSGVVTLWSTARGKRRPLRSKVGWVSSLAFSPDGRVLAMAGREGDTELSDVLTGRALARLEKPRLQFVGPNERRVSSVAFSPSGKWIATASWDNVARIWSVEQGRLASELRGHTDGVSHARFSPDGRYVVTASADGTARVWDWQTPRLVATLRGHQGAVVDAAFCANASCVVTVSLDGTTRVWELGVGGSAGACEPHKAPGATMAVSSDGWLLATGARDGTVKLHDVRAGKTVATLSAGNAEVSGLAFDAAGRQLAASSWDGRARVWQLGKAQPPIEIRASANGLTSVALSADGTRVLTSGFADPGSVWDAHSGTRLAQVQSGQETTQGRPARFLRTAAFSPNEGLAVTTSPQDVVMVWDPSTGRIVAELGGGKDPRKSKRLLTSAAFSPTGTFVVTWRADIETSSEDPEPDFGDSVASIWDARTGQAVAQLSGHDRPITQAIFSPDDRLVATASLDRTARVFEVKSGALVQTLKDHEDVVTAAAFSPDGKFLATASGDRTVRIWQVATGTTVDVFRGDDAFVAVRFASDGRIVAALGLDGSVRLLSCALCGSLSELLRLARTRTTRPLTPQERRTYSTQ